MTEDDAKTKWCPFARVAEISGEGNFASSYNRPDEGQTDEELFPSTARCIASACMAWRWQNAHIETKDGVVLPDHGFCGLAGQP